MGILYTLTIAVVVAIVIGMVFTTFSNHLDPNINPSLDLSNKIDLRGTFTDDERRANNIILRDKLGVFEKTIIILEEMKCQRNQETPLEPSLKSAGKDIHEN